MTLDTLTPREMLALLFRRYHTQLQRFLMCKTHCPQRAEDLAQTAWLKLFNAMARGICGARSEGELRAYVFEVAHNTWLDEYTRKHAESRTRAFDPADFERMIDDSGAAVAPEEELNRAQVRAHLSAAFDALPCEQRDVIRMWSSGTSIRDMARASSAPTDTVLSRKKYALARMRGTLAGLAL